MATDWLKKNLPKEFYKGKFPRGSYSKERDGIIQTIFLEKSDIVYDIDKWLIQFDVSIKDDYGVSGLKGAPNLLIEILLCDRVPRLKNATGFDNYNHWDIDDLESIADVLHEVILPWLDWFTDVGNIIEYVQALDNLEYLTKDAPSIKKFGNILTERIHVYPPRTCKFYNGALATLFKRLGRYDLALEHLKKHREFEIADHGDNTYPPFVKVHLEKMAVIDQGILELEAMQQLHGFIDQKH